MYWKSILTRGLKRLWPGVPATAIAQPFDQAQATDVLNAVLARGTFEEITAVFLALAELGYAAYPSRGNASFWQPVLIEPLHSGPDSAVSEPAPVTVEKPTLGDIQSLAAELEFDFRGSSAADASFALYKRSDRRTGGAWSNNLAGILDAYGYLVRYRLTLEKSDQARRRL